MSWLAFTPPDPALEGSGMRTIGPAEGARSPDKALFAFSGNVQDLSGGSEGSVRSQNSGREWDSLIKPETSLIADLNSLQGRIIILCSDA